MPRPRMNDTVDDDVDDGHTVVIPNESTANVDTASVDAPASDATDNGTVDKKLRGGKRLKVADGTLGLLAEPVKADIPKRGGGRGRTVSPGTLKIIALLRDNPGETYHIGVYAAAAVADGLFKKNGISFSSAAKVITNVDGDEVTVFDRYAVYTPGTEVLETEAAVQD